MNNLYGLAVSKKLPVNGFKWVENTSQFSQDFIENYHEDSNKDVLLKFMFNILKEQKLEYWETCMIKKEYAVHIRSFKQALNRISIEKKV